MFDGIIHFPIAEELYPDIGWVVVDRKSDKKQNRRGELEASVEELASRVPPDRLIGKFSAVEPSKLSKNPPSFRKAVEAAREWKEVNQRTIGIVAWSRRRLYRPEEYDSRTNVYAEPTEDDGMRFKEFTRGVVMATILPPEATAYDERCEERRRNGRAGRPPKDLWKALTLLGRNRNGEYERSLTKAVIRCDVGRDVVSDFLKQPLPPHLVEGEIRTWGDLENPAEIYRQVYPRGRRKSNP